MIFCNEDTIAITPSARECTCCSLRNVSPTVENTLLLRIYTFRACSRNYSGKKVTSLINYRSYNIKTIIHGKRTLYITEKDTILVYTIITIFRCLVSSGVQLGIGKDICEVCSY